MKILVINSGSSSIKFQLINMENLQVLAKGLLERIGIKGSVLNYYQSERKRVIERDIPNHEEGINLIVSNLIDAEAGVIKDKNEIFAVGHRVVHAGEKFNGTVPITEGRTQRAEGVHPPGAPAQPAQHHRHRGLPEDPARHPHGRDLRYRFSPNHARQSLHLPHPL